MKKAEKLSEPVKDKRLKQSASTWSPWTYKDPGMIQNESSFVFGTVKDRLTANAGGPFGPLWYGW